MGFKHPVRRRGLAAVFSTGVSSRMSCIRTQIFARGRRPNRADIPMQTSANNAATAFLTNSGGRGSARRAQTYPYFSARSRAASSLTALWSTRSHLFPHRMTSGLSQYAWTCSWPGGTTTDLDASGDVTHKHAIYPQMRWNEDATLKKNFKGACRWRVNSKAKQEQTCLSAHIFKTSPIKLSR